VALYYLHAKRKSSLSQSVDTKLIVELGENVTAE